MRQAIAIAVLVIILTGAALRINKIIGDYKFNKQNKAMLKRKRLRSNRSSIELAEELLQEMFSDNYHQLKH